MKYYIFFHVITGRDIRVAMPGNCDIENTDIQDRLANELLKKDYLHFVEDGKLVIVNMRNVVYIKVAKAE